MTPNHRFKTIERNPPTSFMESSDFLVQEGMKYREFRNMIKRTLAVQGGSIYGGKKPHVEICARIVLASPAQKKFWAACNKGREHREELWYGFWAYFELQPDDNKFLMTSHFCVDGLIFLGGEPSLLPHITKKNVEAVSESLTRLCRSIASCQYSPAACCY